MMKTITSNQENRIVDLVRDAVRKLGFSKEEAQEIIKAGVLLQKKVKPILQNLAITDKRFGAAVSDFDFTVPVYDHSVQLGTFAEKTKNLTTTFYFNDGLTDKNFANTTRKLEPGKTYRVRIFPIISRVTSEDCMTFLKKKNAILVGAQGITLLQEKTPDKFPVVKWTASFDEKTVLWKDADGCYRVPLVLCHLGGGWRFDLGFFEDYLSDDYCLLCVCEK